MTRDEYYGLSNMASDLLHTHGVEIERDPSWDEEVPQEVIDADNLRDEEIRRANQEAERIARLEYEKNCDNFHIPTCPICREQYDPFSQHRCSDRSYDQGGA
jgi:hypothetical protein